MKVPNALGQGDHDMESDRSCVLVVDDNEYNRDVLARHLERRGHVVAVAENGRRALELMQAQEFDLVLLDIVMPEMDGYRVLSNMRLDPTLRHIPVLVLSAVDEFESVVRCIELGAEDYLTKPLNPILLRARIGAALEKKQLHDREQAYLKALEFERERSERLLLNILPEPIADRLKQGQSPIADRFEEVTVLFADIVNFTPLSAYLPAAELIDLLSEIFSAFDRLTERYGLEKIKTLGDGYMAVGGLPIPRPDHAEAVAEMALDMQEEIIRFKAAGGESFRMRIGINTGSVVAGVIGTKKFTYDLWGDTVNTAKRMEQHGLAGRIQVTAATHERLQDRYQFEERGAIPVKGKGEMITYFLTGRKVQAPAAEETQNGG
jgi:class 3 adenylate cyclase